MNIVQLKTKMFSDLKDPMSFLSHKQLTSTGPPNECRSFAGTTYFYVDGEEWRVTSPECSIENSTINAHTTPQQIITLKVPQTWSEKMLTQLKDAAKLAFDHGCIKHNDGDLQDVLKHCHIPKMLTVETYAFTKRGKNPIYVPIYHNNREITGTYTPEVGDRVQLTVRWTLCQSVQDDRIVTGFRPLFSGGLQIVRRNGWPTPIRKPWNWQPVDWRTLTIPMYSCVCVRIPCMLIESLDGHIAKVSPPDDFEAAMQRFHKKASAQPWNHCITLQSGGHVGAKLMATIVPNPDNNQIVWTCVKQRILQSNPNVTAAVAVVEEVEVSHIEAQKGQKRPGDNTDTSCNAKTKRLCIANGNDDHSQDV